MALSETEDYWRRLQQRRRGRSSSSQLAIFSCRTSGNAGSSNVNVDESRDSGDNGKTPANNCSAFVPVDLENTEFSSKEDEYDQLLLSAIRNKVTVLPSAADSSSFSRSPNIDKSFPRSPSAESVEKSDVTHRAFKRKRRQISDINSERLRYARSKSLFIRSSDFGSDCCEIDNVPVIVKDESNRIGNYLDSDSSLDTSNSHREIKRLLRSATDLRTLQSANDGCYDYQRDSKVLPLGHKSQPFELSNGNLTDSHKLVKTNFLTKSWYGNEGNSSFSDSSNNFFGNDYKHPWNRFTSVPEDATDVGDIALDREERVVLLERSSLATVIPESSAFSTSAFPTNVNCKTDSSSASASLSNSSANKLGKWSRSKIDLLVPSIKSLVSMTTGKLSSNSKPANLSHRNSTACCMENGYPQSSTSNLLRRNISLNSVTVNEDASTMMHPSTDSKLRKCNTMVTLSNTPFKSSTITETRLHLEPLRPVNRLRITPGTSSDMNYPPSRICSRCSSILSMASSSRYSLSSALGFVQIKAPGVLCKVCLNEVPIKDSWTLQHCECSYCVDCVRSYVEFEINQGAYSISCPDAECEKQGIILLEEIESLVSLENVEKHKRYRLNTEVEMDKSRTWCPRAGCETVCTLCNADRLTPQNVHCPTCNTEFCSNCRQAWHEGSRCKTEDTVPGVTFDSELIKCCPMCSVPIEKDEGCAQMLCKRCKHVFCWYCLASLDDDFLLRHYDKGPCKNKLGHSRASVIWHRTQVISIFAGFGILLLIASPLLLLAAPCIVCCKCRVCTSDSKLDNDDDIPDVEYRPKTEDVANKDEDT